MKHLLWNALLLAGLAGCAKNEQATPTVPANTLRLTVKGQPVTFPASAATVVLSNRGTQWCLTAKATDATRAGIQVTAFSSGASLEEPGRYAATPPGSTGGAYSEYGYRVLADFKNACGTTIYQNGYITYNTGVIPAGLPDTLPEFTLTIVTVDAAAHTMSGSFAGTYWKGCDKLDIADGQFNLPYTVQP